jgi:hypothetical protein
VRDRIAPERFPCPALQHFSFLLPLTQPPFIIIAGIHVP